MSSQLVLDKFESVEFKPSKDCILVRMRMVDGQEINKTISISELSGNIRNLAKCDLKLGECVIKSIICIDGPEEALRRLRRKRSDSCH